MRALLSTTFTMACTASDPVGIVAAGSSGPLDSSASETSGGDGEGAPPDLGAAKECTCRARCIEFNRNGEKVAFYNVDVGWTMAANDVCEVTQLIRDLLYYECMNSIIHPDYAELDPDPGFNCREE